MVSERVSQWDEVRQQKEADKGNAHVIAYGSAGKVSSALFYAVIGEKPAQIRIDGESLNVNGIRIPFFRFPSSAIFYRKRAVMLSGTERISSRVPDATIRPPSEPPPGPMSMI